MKIRSRVRKSFRNGLGLDQIMATLLVVLPTIAFSVTMLFGYWNVMQVDYKLKLIANLASDFANSREELEVFGDASTAAFITRASTLCPEEQTIQVTSLANNNAIGEISITVEYTTPADDLYFASKTLSTNIQTYSYHDQNMSIVLTCPTTTN